MERDLRCWSTPLWIFVGRKARQLISAARARGDLDSFGEREREREGGGIRKAAIRQVALPIKRTQKVLREGAACCTHALRSRRCRITATLLRQSCAKSSLPDMGKDCYLLADNDLFHNFKTYDPDLGTFYGLGHTRHCIVASYRYHMHLRSSFRPFNQRHASKLNTTLHVRTFPSADGSFCFSAYLKCTSKGHIIIYYTHKLQITLYSKCISHLIFPLE